MAQVWGRDTPWAIRAEHVSIQEKWLLSLNVFTRELMKEEVLGFAI